MDIDLNETVKDELIDFELDELVNVVVDGNELFEVYIGEEKVNEHCGDTGDHNLNDRATACAGSLRLPDTVDSNLNECGYNAVDEHGVSTTCEKEISVDERDNNYNLQQAGEDGDGNNNGFQQEEIDQYVDLHCRIEKLLEVGSTFESLDQVYILYCEYIQSMGFSVKKGCQSYFQNTSDVKMK